MADTLEELDRRTHLHPFTSIAEHAARRRPTVSMLVFFSLN
jgi:hypothetical protein